MRLCSHQRKTDYGLQEFTAKVVRGAGIRTWMENIFPNACASSYSYLIKIELAMSRKRFF